MTFSDYAIRDRLGKDNKLVKVNRLINWFRIKDLLSEYKFSKNEVDPQGGRKAYDKLKMFKAILLGQWHSLSDEGLEEALILRTDFVYFCNFSLEEPSPDKTTLCRFRNKLVDSGLLEKLNKEINAQLEQIGLKMKASKGAIVDATLIKSGARPRKIVKTKDISRDRKESESDDNQADVELSKDKDARWKKKGKKFVFGYQGYIKVDDDKGFIEEIDMSPANKSEAKEFEKSTKIDDEKKGRRIYYDKGVESKKNRKLLKENNLKDGIMHKAQKNKPLTRWQKKFNSLVNL